ncbi:enoyl-CoA hydratase-related protein [Novosphingobium cyanobacteriorum]|uniref:Enoyl-CoA hydratase-related protein n=1 Tax=Novosphingobium cyanobacteriorum TaxID=3024215 RepID=A0ABT6CIN1_9SPHN|nr:enoyl-CoA hydratase-related protein [Novosphingobium cyanobacteriorum]MDF8332207.1 enoyl-CoA hydratase-related protein [Novosphingobium cyanobacteriorum]
MDYSRIIYERADDVAIIRLNAPQVLNAVDMRMIEEIDHAVGDAERTARALMLAGEGRAFCAGANLSGDLGAVGEDGLPDAGAVLETAINPLMLKLSSLAIPLITAVRGAAAGVGCSFALVGDLVVASESAYFLQAFARIGLVPDGGSTWLLMRGLSRTRALELMLLGERLPAAKALEWGLINRLTAEDDLENTALALATALARGPTRSLGMIREAAWAAADATFTEAMATERRLQREAGLTRDHQEGAAAFMEKRAARFTGA